MSDNNHLIVAREALRRCGYAHRNSTKALCAKLALLNIQMIVRNGRNFFFASDIAKYLESLATPSNEGSATNG